MYASITLQHKVVASSNILIGSCNIAITEAETNVASQL